MLGPITFVVAVSSKEILENNFLSSDCLRGPHSHQLITQEHFRTAARAYNDAISRSKNDLMVFAHQDLVLPNSWLSDLERALQSLAISDPNWGVLGCYGVTVDNQRRGYAYTSGYGILGKAFVNPEPVQTIDEMVLILRKSSSLRFNELLPHFHLYGADICMAAARRNMSSYVISAFCIHNTNDSFILPPQFYQSYWLFKSQWKDLLPIQTTCIRVTRFNLLMYKRRLWEAYLKYVRRREFAGVRSSDVPTLLKRVDAMARQQVAAGLLSQARYTA